MAAPDIVLNYPNILVSQTISSITISIESFGMLYGYVEAVYETSDKTAIGDVILFDPKKAVQIRYGSTIYYMLDEETASFTETPPP
jgi:hypothetical protein